MKLSSRLQCIYNMVPNTVTADVGSDHGKLIISLFKDGKIKKGYAIENKKGPFTRLKNAIESAECLDGVTPMFSDGISELPLDCETVIIAGMGGLTILDILKKDLSKLKNVTTLIVDAHNAIPMLRREISALNYVIAEEHIVYEDGIYYEIIKFVRGNSLFLDDKDAEFGPFLRNEKSQIFIDKYLTRISEIDNLLSNTNLPTEKVVKLSEEKTRIKNVL